MIPLLETWRFGAVQEVRQVHAGVGLSCPEWDCRCHQEPLWEVGLWVRGWCLGEFVRLG